MNDAELLNLAMKTLELRDLIKNEGKWKERYLLRALIVKTLFDKEVTLKDLETGMRQALE